MTGTGRGHTYCRGRLKRGFDILVVLAACPLLLPLLVILGLCVLLASGAPVLFIQERVGMDGHLFRLLKFRTMRPDAGLGLPITSRGDARVTPLGRLMRATKLDELPQLINVLLGDMSLVGPRPEVPRYVAAYTPEQRRVLVTRPGLTDPATLLYRNEEDLLDALEEEKRERYYVDHILPSKLRLNLDYLDRAGFWYDLALLVRTVKVIVFPERA